MTHMHIPTMPPPRDRKQWPTPKHAGTNTFGPFSNAACSFRFVERPRDVVHCPDPVCPRHRPENYTGIARHRKSGAL